MIATTLLSVAMLASLSTDPVPEGTRPAIWSQQLTINAIPTHVSEWILDLSLEQSADFYRGFLGKRHVEFDGARRSVLAAPVAGRFVSVELQRVDASRTRARVSEAEIGAASRGEEFIPVPVNTRILSTIAAGQRSERSQTVIARTSSDLGATISFYQQALTAKGLRLTGHRTQQNQGRRSELLSFSGSGRNVELVLTRDAAQTWISAVSAGEMP